MEDNHPSELQARTSWTDELVGILNSNSSRSQKSAAARLLGRLAHPDRLEELEALLLEPGDDPWMRVSLLRAFRKRSLSITPGAFDRLVHEFVHGLGPWHGDHSDAPSDLLTLGRVAGHDAAIARFLDALDASSLRRLFSSRSRHRIDKEHRAAVYDRLVARGGLDAALAWSNLEFDASQELAIQGPIRWDELHHASDAFTRRCFRAFPPEFEEAVATLALPVRWLMETVPLSRLADTAEEVLAADERANIHKVCRLLAAADDGAQRIDALLTKELRDGTRDGLVRVRLGITPVNPGLEPAYHMLRWALHRTEDAPLELIEWACGHERPAFQCLGVEALFERQGATSERSCYALALASDPLCRAAALRFGAAGQDEGAIAELMRMAAAHESAVVRAEALRSLRLSVPASDIAALSVASLRDDEIVSQHYAPVATEAASALRAAPDLDGEKVLRELVDAMLDPASHDSSCAIDSAIGTWVGDDVYAYGTPWRRGYWE